MFIYTHSKKPEYVIAEKFQYNQNMEDGWVCANIEERRDDLCQNYNIGCRNCSGYKPYVVDSNNIRHIINEGDFITLGRDKKKYVYAEELFDQFFEEI